MKSRIAFILGSGFSKDMAEYPVLRELSAKIKEFMMRNDNCNRHLRNFLFEAVPSKIFDNIEHLMTYLFQDFPWRNNEDKHLAKAAYFEVSKAVSTFFNDLEQEKKTKVLGNSDGKELIHYWHKWESSIITFNYDTLIEKLICDGEKQKRASVSRKDNYHLKMLESLEVNIGDELPSKEKFTEISVDFDKSSNRLLINLSCRKELDFEIIKGKLDKRYHEDWKAFGQNLINRLNTKISLENLYQIPISNIKARTASLLSGEEAQTLSLFKLHGSVNWFYSGGADYSGEPIYYQSLDENRDREIALALRNRCDLVPLIIPPVLDKNAFYSNNSLRTQWTSAKNIIAEADTVYVVGYSLPETDLSMGLLLREAFGRKGEKSKIVVIGKGNSKINTDNEEMKKRYKELVGDDSRIEFVIADDQTSSTSLLLKMLSTV